MDANKQPITLDRKIKNIVMQLRSLDKVRVEIKGSNILVISDYVTIPSFKLYWIEGRDYFRVYISVYDKDMKEYWNRGYPVMVVGDTLAAMDFCALFRTMYKNKSRLGTTAD